MKKLVSSIANWISGVGYRKLYRTISDDLSPTRRESLLTSQRGFTLIEILIALAVISVLAVVVIPNFKQFSQDQELQTASSALLQVLRQTQSSATTGVICASSQPSSEWYLDLTPSGYTVYATCTTSDADPTPLSSKVGETVQYASGISMYTTSCGDGLAARVKFTKYNTQFVCDPKGTATPYNNRTFDILLHDVRISSSKENTITLDGGGAMKLFIP